MSTMLHQWVSLLLLRVCGQVPFGVVVLATISLVFGKWVSNDVVTLCHGVYMRTHVGFLWHANCVQVRL